MKLSVVIPTLNRLNFLKTCLESVSASATGISFEIIVVDGGSTDGTLKYLKRYHKNIELIEQGEAHGWVHAFNAGAYYARGQYVAHLNDDCTCVGDVLKNATLFLERHDGVGQVAIPYARGDNKPVVQYMRIPAKLGRLVMYANFGITCKCLGDRVGWAGTYLKHYAGDCELSMQVWAAGCKVEAFRHGNIIHHEADDLTRIRQNNDSATLYEHWKNWRWDGH